MLRRWIPLSILSLFVAPLMLLQPQASPVAMAKLINPMIAQGDMIVGGVAGTPARIPAPPAPGMVLMSNAQSQPFWTTPPWATGANPPPTTAPPSGGGPTITSGPTVSSITQTSVVITWTCNELCSGQVAYGTTSSYGSLSTFQAGGVYSTQTQTLSGLTAGTTYHYKVMSQGASDGMTSSSDGTFTTSAPTSPTITGVSVVPSTLSIATNSTQGFTATVTGTGAYSSSVTWSAS